jgi:hypothetical protein
MLIMLENAMRWQGGRDFEAGTRPVRSAALQKVGGGSQKIFFELFLCFEVLRG